MSRQIKRNERQNHSIEWTDLASLTGASRAGGGPRKTRNRRKSKTTKGTKDAKGSGPKSSSVDVSNATTLYSCPCIPCLPWLTLSCVFACFVVDSNAGTPWTFTFLATPRGKTASPQSCSIACQARPDQRRPRVNSARSVHECAALAVRRSSTAGSVPLALPVQACRRRHWQSQRHTSDQGR